MENSNNKSNKKAIMEVLCEESHSEQINIYVTSVRFSHEADAMIFNYKTLIWSFTYISDPQPRVLKAAMICSLIPVLIPFFCQSQWLFNMLFETY